MDDETRDLEDWGAALPQEYRLPIELPKALDAEQAALGALMLDPRWIDRVRLAPEDMYLDRHRWVLQALLALRERSNVLTVHAWLDERGMAEQVGGLAYLTSLDLMLPDPSCLPDLVRMIQERATRRRCIEMMMRTARAAARYDQPVNQILGDTLAGCRSLIHASHPGGFRQLGEILEELLVELEDREAHPPEPGLTFGIPDLDEIAGGMERRHMWLLAARPGVGKTSMLLQVAAREALEEGRHVAIFSLEMDERELVMRVAGQRLGLDTRRARRATLTPDEWRSLLVLARDIRSAGTIHVDQQASIDLPTMAARVEELASRVPLSAVFVDFLTLMEGGDGDGYERVMSNSRGLAALFKTANVKGLVAAQLKRPKEGGANRKPHLEDLRQAGEEPAWGVVMLHREIRTNGDAEWLASETEFIVPKNRTGPTGKASGRFHGPTQRFLP